MFTKKSLLAGAAALAVGSMANAAITLHVDPVYLGSYDTDYTPLGQLDLNTRDGSWAGYKHEFYFTMQLDGLAAGQDFANLGMNVSLNGAPTNPTFTPLVGWTQVGGGFDMNGTTAGGNQNHWDNNKDAGDVTDDLQGILVNTIEVVANNRQYGETPRPTVNTTATSADNYRRNAANTAWVAQIAYQDVVGTDVRGSDMQPNLLGTYGMGYPTIFGYIVMTDNATNDVTISATPGTGTYLQVFVNNQSGSGTNVNAESLGSVSFASEGIYFPFIPEPASLGLLGVAGLMLARRRS